MSLLIQEVIPLLTERQLEIVLALVYEYIQTGEPVGSRTLSKKYLTDHSPATVRNEMADLEEMGFFNKPHSSAGRVPGARAYRLYVDSILSRRNTLDDDEGSLISSLDLQLQGLEHRLSEVSSFLSRLTQCFGVAALWLKDEPLPLKFDLIPLSLGRSVAVMVTQSGEVLHAPIQHDLTWGESATGNVGNLIERLIRGRPLSEGLAQVEAFAQSLDSEERGTVMEIVGQLRSMTNRSKMVYHTAGVQGLYQAASSGQLGSNAAQVFSIVEQEHAMEDLFSLAPTAGISVTIGGENGPDALRDCSVVLASDQFEGRQALLGLVGPLRMNYQKSIALLDALMASILRQGKGS